MVIFHSYVKLPEGSEDPVSKDLTASTIKASFCAFKSWKRFTWENDGTREWRFEEIEDWRKRNGLGKYREFQVFHLEKMWARKASFWFLLSIQSIACWSTNMRWSQYMLITLTNNQQGIRYKPDPKHIIRARKDSAKHIISARRTTWMDQQKSGTPQHQTEDLPIENGDFL